MELKPCKCGSTDIVLRVGIRNKTGKAVYCYQCNKCKKAGYAWAEFEELDAELWNDTVK